MIIRPAYIPADISSHPLSFKWSEKIALGIDSLDPLPKVLSDQIAEINYKARYALSLACLEWVLWRLEGLTDITDSILKIEAAWVFALNKQYAKSLAFFKTPLYEKRRINKRTCGIQ